MGGKILLLVLLLALIPSVIGATCDPIIVEDDVPDYELLELLGADEDSVQNNVYSDHLGSKIWVSEGKGYLLTIDCDKEFEDLIELHPAQIVEKNPQITHTEESMAKLVEKNPEKANKIREITGKNAETAFEKIINTITRWFKREN